MRLTSQEPVDYIRQQKDVIIQSAKRNLVVKWSDNTQE